VSQLDPIVVTKLVPKHFSRYDQETPWPDPEHIYYALAANCVCRVRQRSGVRFSLSDDENAIFRVIRLLKVLDAR
jgi:hypothetical protein